MNFQVRTLDPKDVVNDENCTGNTSDGNNTWYKIICSLQPQLSDFNLSLSLCMHVNI